MTEIEETLEASVELEPEIPFMETVKSSKSRNSKRATVSGTYVTAHAHSLELVNMEEPNPETRSLLRFLFSLTDHLRYEGPALVSLELLP